MKTLRLFCDVARHRSFSQAAVENGITQSAASQRVGQLEKKLGVTLIDRSVRPLGLTQAGEMFALGAQELLERYDRLTQRVTQLQPQLEGHLYVDAIYSAGIDLLNHLKERFEALHPRVTVTVEYKQAEQVVEAVRQNRCDLGIVSWPRDWRDVGVIPLRDEVMAVVCSPDHELAGRDSIHAGQLEGQELVTFESTQLVGRRIRKYLREHGVHPKITHVFDNIDTIKTAVALTEVVSILPTRTVLREVARGTLKALPLAPQLVRPIGIIHPRRGKRAGGGGLFSQAAQAFVNFSLEHAGPEPDTVDEQEARGRELVGGKL